MSRTIRANVSGGAGGERFDRRAIVKRQACTARRRQDGETVAEALNDFHNGTDEIAAALDWLSVEIRNDNALYALQDIHHGE